MKDQIRKVLVDHGGLTRPVDTIADDANLYQAGMTSHASVNVMLALEGNLGIEFPDAMMRRSVFETITSIHVALDTLTASR